MKYKIKFLFFTSLCHNCCTESVTPDYKATLNAVFISPVLSCLCHTLKPWNMITLSVYCFLSGTHSAYNTFCFFRDSQNNAPKLRGCLCITSTMIQFLMGGFFILNLSGVNLIIAPIANLIYVNALSLVVILASILSLLFAANLYFSSEFCENKVKGIYSLIVFALALVSALGLQGILYLNWSSVVFYILGAGFFTVHLATLVTYFCY